MARVTAESRHIEHIMYLGLGMETQCELDVVEGLGSEVMLERRRNEWGGMD